MKTLQSIISVVILSYALLACNTKNQEKKDVVEIEPEVELPLIAEGEKLTLVSDVYEFTEGPAADAEGNVFFTDQPNNQILKWDATTNQISVFMKPAGRSNGLYFDNDGNLMACADEKFELWQIDANKNITVLLDNYQDKKLNGPNDLWMDVKGGIYFTDPYYQRPYWTRTKGELDTKNVYYLSPDKSDLKKVTTDLLQPNGIIGSKDGKMIYVSDADAGKIYSYTINTDASFSDKTLFVSEKSDGMTLDNRGNVYITNSKGVTAFNSKGEQVLNVPTGKGWTANVTFGGKNQDILFITALDAVFTLKMNVKGIR